MTPLHDVAAVASRLGLSVLETPASVDIVNRQEMQEQGYRTVTDTAQGAVGVLAGDAAGAPTSFSMRGFTGNEVNVLYNGIWVGPSDVATRWIDTSNLAQVEFLKGPSALMSGMDAIGGTVNIVNRQPTTGPVQNEADVSMDSLGSITSHYGSGGSTPVKGLDYRFDVAGSQINSFIDGDYRDFGDIAGQLNYHVNRDFMVFGAVDYKTDSGHAYWGTPLVPTSFAGANAVNGVVAGSAVNTFFGQLIAPVTIDSRTLTTNYNVADNGTGSRELWLRTGFEWTPLSNLTVKDQTYFYRATRSWVDSETYAFEDGTAGTGVPGTLPPNTIDRDRFAVRHSEYLGGNNLDYVLDSSPFGFDNRFAGEIQASQMFFKFSEDNEGGFPQDQVSVVAPASGLYGPIDYDIRKNVMDTIAVSAEDRLKLTPAFALIGGIKAEDITLIRNGINFDGSIPDGQPFTKVWKPVSYRAAATYEPIKDLVFYGMYATSYDPAAGLVFSLTPDQVQLTSSRIYEAGAKQVLWDGRAEWTFAVYDINRRNVVVSINDTTSALAGEEKSKGYELAGAVTPVEGLKLWSNIAWTHARWASFDDPGVGSFTGNTPPDIAPLIYNAGVSYRFDHWRWPVEIGASVRHVANRFVFDDDATTMLSYTTADIYSFVDIPGKDIALPELKTVRVSFRVRNLTNAVYAQWADPGLPDQVILGAPRTYEVAASAKW
jgi:iron complex outermembrane receptor protein